MRRLSILLAALLMSMGSLLAQNQQWFKRHILSDKHAMMSVNTQKRYILLPIEEKENETTIKVIKDGHSMQSIKVRLATGKPDYFVPLDISKFGKDGKVLFDFSFQGNYRTVGNIEDYSCWQLMKESDTFDTTNREAYRPVYHHTPLWGWMNDPNGLFYKDGVWNLYFQYNPYGSTWENMTWGHATSHDLVHWQYEGTPVEPDALGTIFSGSAVVDSANTAGFGKNAIVAMYTSAAESQTQSLAYSTDGGKTFTKYSDNPTLTAKEPDFRDPKMIWNEATNEWNLVMATGQKMNFYSSKDLKNWKYESSFGEGYGCHKGVWECPDLIQMDNGKWVLFCNINPGGPFGGSATQYFVGQWDGHQFTCESKPEVTKWMDYGKDHYATVTFSNAPDGRHVALPWMSNWQYAAVVPTKQYRSGNGIPRDLGIFTDGNEDYLSVKPSPEIMKAFSKKAQSLGDACMVEVSGLRRNATIELSNGKGERVVMRYDAAENSFSVDRMKSGQTDFSDVFASVTTAPTHGKVSRVLIFIDKSSVEVFDADGKFALTNLVFPTKPYDRLTVKGGKSKIWKLR
ncbi:MAG: DUF4980 domain-containing protein [Prevotella sp.]